MHLPLHGALAPLTQSSKVPSSLVSGLMAYWKLEEASGSRADVLGVATLTDNNSVTSTTGKIGDAAVTTNTRFLSRAGTAFQFAGVDFTISAWANPTTLVGANALGRCVCRCSNGDATGDWILGVTADGGVSGYHWKSAGTDATGRHITTTTALVSLTTWTHVVFRRSSGTYTIWTNGVSRVFTDATSSSGFGNVGYQMGRMAAGAGFAWEGALDETGIWNRGITDAEVASLYNAGAGNQYPFS